MGKLSYLPEVITLQFDQSLCNGCGLCVQVCPHRVFMLEGGKARLLRRNYCMECGACTLNCKTKAIRVKSGVGCAAGVLNGLIRGTEPSCDCSSGNSGCC